MMMTTTSGLEGYEITDYIGIVSGHAVVGANAASDFMAGFTGFMGGRSTAYEKKVRKAEDAAMEEIAAEARDRGATAVIGVHVDFETIMLRDKDALLAMAVSGTAVKAVRKNSADKPSQHVAAQTPSQNWEKLSPLVTGDDLGAANRPK
jgi:uncharacterized protein YbjQ (UPF0145 family)